MVRRPLCPRSRADDRTRNAAGIPKYGYVLLADGAIVDLVLSICSSMIVHGESRLRVSPSNWYVDPAFRVYATIMTARLRAYKQATHLNLTPAPHTWPILEALGFRPFCRGAFVALAALSGRSFTATVRRASADIEPGNGPSASEAELLRAHAGFGCISVVCEWEQRRHPSVFVHRWTPWQGIMVPFAQLLYCRDFDSDVQLAGPLGRFLLRRGLVFIFSDANGPVPRLIGRYVDWGPKFSRGPNPPHFSDLAYTEWAVFTPESIDMTTRAQSALPACATDP